MIPKKVIHKDVKQIEPIDNINLINNGNFFSSMISSSFSSLSIVSSISFFNSSLNTFVCSEIYSFTGFASSFLTSSFFISLVFI